MLLASKLKVHKIINHGFQLVSLHKFQLLRQMLLVQQNRTRPVELRHLRYHQ